MTSANVIDLSGTSTQVEGVVGSVAVTPGMLVDYDGSALVIAHATAGGQAQRLFVRENEFVGKGIADNIAISDTVQLAYFPPGGMVNAILIDGAVIVKGDAVESNGDGKLRKHVPQVVDQAGTGTVAVIVDQIVGYADEDLSPSGADGRLAVRLR